MKSESKDPRVCIEQSSSADLIPETEPAKETATWQSDVRRGVRRVEDLARLPLTPGELDAARKASKLHKVRIPGSLIDRINWDDPNDPIRLQVIPSSSELNYLPEEQEDPIGDHAFSPVPRLTHRYPDRVLLYPTYLCAVYCRYCFRKETLTSVGRGYKSEFLDEAMAYIAENEGISEVILTGGDPLALDNRALQEIRTRLESISHVKMLRIHTRVPVALPTRIDEGLIAALSGRLRVCVVSHFNHPAEISSATDTAYSVLRRGGFMLLNQSVLLKGVNDDATVLRDLFTDLVFRLGVKPYYLHHCDLVRGMSHMRTSIADGLEIMRQLRGYISGLCQPTYVLDLPGGAGKVPLGPTHVIEQSGSHWKFRTYSGECFEYNEVLDDTSHAQPAGAD